MTEIDIVNAIIKYLKAVSSCFCWKEHGGLYATSKVGVRVERGLERVSCRKIWKGIRME